MNSNEGEGIDIEEDCAVGNRVENAGNEERVHSDGWLMTWVDGS